jgi:S-formylglutathione hydrolase FrmB
MKGILLAAFTAMILALPACAADSSSFPAMSTNAAPEAPKPPRETTPEGCIIERFTVHSPSMDRDIRAAAVLPPEYESHPDKKYPVLYTLHGSDAPYDTYSAMIPLRTALRDKPMIVLCMDGDGDSMYIDSPNLLNPGRKYLPATPVKSLFTTFFLKEFIPAIDAKYRTDAKRRMLTGFSMGGFGAFHYMLEAPGQFVSVSSLSGFFPDWSTAPTTEGAWLETSMGSYAEHASFYHQEDLRMGIRKQVADGVKLPPFFLACGSSDHLLEQSRSMHKFLTDLGLPCEYVEDPGNHDWHFWRDHSAAIINFHWSTLPK